MQLYMCYHGRLIFKTVCIFVFRLLAQPSQGWLARRIILPYVYTRLWHIWLFPWDFFVLQDEYSDTLNIFFCCILSRAWSGNLEDQHDFAHSLSYGSLLYSWGVSFDCFVFPTFWEGIRSGISNLRVMLLRELVLRICTDFWRYTSCFQVASSIGPLLAGRVLVGSSWYRGSLLINSLQIFQRDCFAIVSDIPGNHFPTSWCFIWAWNFRPRVG